MRKLLHLCSLEKKLCVRSYFHTVCYLHYLFQKYSADEISFCSVSFQRTFLHHYNDSTILSYNMFLLLATSMTYPFIPNKCNYISIDCPGKLIKALSGPVDSNHKNLQEMVPSRLYFFHASVILLYGEILILPANHLFSRISGYSPFVRMMPKIIMLRHRKEVIICGVVIYTPKLWSCLTGY